MLRDPLQTFSDEGLYKAAAYPAFDFFTGRWVENPAGGASVQFGRTVRTRNAEGSMAEKPDPI